MSGNRISRFNGTVLLFILIGLSRGMPFKSAENGTTVISLNSECRVQRYLVGAGSSIQLETSDGSQYEKGLNCKAIFKADGDCSLLMQCSKFRLQNPRDKDGKCTRDFLFIRKKGGYKGKHCGSDNFFTESRNYGKKLMTRFRTNADSTVADGISCQITCCPQEDLSEAVVDVIKASDVPVVQKCNSGANSVDNKCGIRGAPGKIVGGEDTEKNEFTWMALLTTADTSYKRIFAKSKKFKKTFPRARKNKPKSLDIEGLPRNHVPFCGGSLISRSWILTAAHCTFKINGQYRPDRFRIVLGEWQRRSDGETTVRVHTITKQIPHPTYNKRNYDNDIALWKLESPADQNYFRVVCLAVPGMRLRNPLTVAGWGTTKEGGIQADVLQKVDVAAVSRETCTKAMDPFEITENMICAGGVKGEDSCQGDSGGPLMGQSVDADQQDGQMIQAGVVSWGLGCAREGLYGVYAKVSNVHVWIQETIAT